MITLSPSCETPASNTGLIPQRPFISSVDTLTVMFCNVGSGRGAFSIQALIEEVFHEKIDFDINRPTFMMTHWAGCSSSSLLGTQLHWMAPSDDRPGKLRVHLTGKALSAADSKEVRDLMQVLTEVYSGRCSRIDVAADDYSKITDLEELKRAQEERNYTGVRSHRWAGSGGIGMEDGLTYYFGSTSSDSQLRIYDKKVESKGQMDCIRWELQARRGKAQNLYQRWLDPELTTQKEIASVLAGAVAGAVDFIDRSGGEKDLSRCSRLSWWERILDCLGAAYRLRAPVRVPTIANKIGWVCRAVAPSLAAIKEYLGDRSFWQFMEDEIKEKRAVMSSLNRAVVAEALDIDAKEAEKGRQKPLGLVDFVAPSAILGFADSC